LKKKWKLKKKNIDVLLEKHKLSSNKQKGAPSKELVENLQNLNKKAVAEWKPETVQDELLIKKKEEVVTHPKPDTLEKKNKINQLLNQLLNQFLLLMFLM